MKDREIHKAVEKGDLKLLKEIIAKKVKKEKRYTIDVYTKTGDGDDMFTPLHLACGGSAGKLSIVTCLVEAGANVDLKDYRGNTPLISACFWGYDDIVFYLLPKVKNIDETNIESETALTIACNMMQPSIVALLLENGADPEKIKAGTYISDDIEPLISAAKSKKIEAKSEQKEYASNLV